MITKKAIDDDDDDDDDDDNTNTNVDDDTGIDADGYTDNAAAAHEDDYNQ